MWKLSDGTEISRDGVVKGSGRLAPELRRLVKERRDGKTLVMAVERSGSVNAGTRRVMYCGDFTEMIERLGAKHGISVRQAPDPAVLLPKWKRRKPTHRAKS